jgi:hypothetical protein
MDAKERSTMSKDAELQKRIWETAQAVRLGKKLARQDEARPALIAMWIVIVFIAFVLLMVGGVIK